MASSDSLSDVSLSDNGTQDEVSEIKRAIRVATAKQAALSESHRSDYIGLQHYRSICDQQQNEIVALKDELKRKDLELREFKYESKKIILSKKKESISISKLKNSLEKVEKVINEKHEVLRTNCNHLIRLVAGLEKHTMHGLHIVASRTAVGLLLKIRQGLESLSSSLGKVNVHTEDQNISSKSKTTPSNEIHSLIDICRQLQEENTELKEKLDSIDSTNLKPRSNNLTPPTDVMNPASLIPHYRLEIIRARAETTSIQQQLVAEKTLTASLQSQVVGYSDNVSKLTLELQQLYGRLDSMQVLNRNLEVELERFQSMMKHSNVGSSSIPEARKGSGRAADLKSSYMPVPVHAPITQSCRTSTAFNTTAPPHYVAAPAPPAAFTAVPQNRNDTFPSRRHTLNDPTATTTTIPSNTFWHAGLAASPPSPPGDALSKSDWRNGSDRGQTAHPVESRPPSRPPSPAASQKASPSFLAESSFSHSHQRQGVSAVRSSQVDYGSSDHRIRNTSLSSHYPNAVSGLSTSRGDSGDNNGPRHHPQAHNVSLSSDTFFAGGMAARTREGVRSIDSSSSNSSSCSRSIDSGAHSTGLQTTALPNLHRDGLKEAAIVNQNSQETADSLQYYKNKGTASSENGHRSGSGSGRGRERGDIPGESSSPTKPIADQKSRSRSRSKEKDKDVSVKNFVSESEVQRDLSSLDAEIERLRNKLQSVALLQTQQIVSQVMDSANNPPHITLSK